MNSRQELATEITDAETIARNNAIMANLVNALSARIGNWADRKGFHEPVKNARWLDNLARRLDENGMGKVSVGNQNQTTLSDKLHEIAVEHRTLHLGMKIALAHSELSEALETLRKTGADNLEDGNMPEELDDAVIRLLDLDSIIGHHPGDGILEKMEVNEKRPYKHGKVA